MNCGRLLNSERLSELEREVLAVLRMDPETSELLGEALPEEWEVSEDTLRSCLAEMEERGLVRGTKGWYGDTASGECVEALWWQLTGKGKTLAESR